MATAPSRTQHLPSDDGGRPGVPRRDARLAELVAGLSSYDDEAALGAVQRQADADDPLEVVARALTGLRWSSREPQDRLRVAGFLRTAERPLPRRRPPGTVAVIDRAEYHLVHHGSLRRWERAGDDLATPGGDHPEPSDDGDQVIDLRDRTARFRRPAPGSPRGA